MARTVAFATKMLRSSTDCACSITEERPGMRFARRTGRILQGGTGTTSMKKMSVGYWVLSCLAEFSTGKSSDSSVPSCSYSLRRNIWLSRASTTSVDDFTSSSPASASRSCSSSNDFAPSCSCTRAHDMQVMRSRLLTVRMKNGLYTTRSSSISPKWPSHVLTSRVHVAQISPNPHGPIAGSYSPDLTGLPIYN
uniref:Uncharacterized protein n=1 Tax=Anopheles coluzzii TaxID=1518534 RepID=A0A8W7P282_ANOCL